MRFLLIIGNYEGKKNYEDCTHSIALCECVQEFRVYTIDFSWSLTWAVFLLFTNVRQQAATTVTMEMTQFSRPPAPSQGTYHIGFPWWLRHPHTHSPFYSFPFVFLHPHPFHSFISHKGPKMWDKPWGVPNKLQDLTPNIPRLLWRPGNSPKTERSGPTKDPRGAP